MENDYFRFQLGNFECVSLYDGYHDYDLEQMITNAPRPEVEAALQAHGLSTQALTTPFTSLYVDTGKYKILVDCGGGELLPTTGKLPQSMHNAGIAPENIDHVIFTHAHADHTGGALDAKGEPIFTHAVHMLWKTEWNFWLSDEALVQAGEWMTTGSRKRLIPLKDKVKLLESEGEILPGVSVLFAPGHTPGHMVVSFTNNKERLLYTGDTVLHPIHLEHPDWLPVFDLLPEVAATSKQHVFDLAASSKCWVMGQQFPPFPSLGHVVKKDIGWEWKPTNSNF